MTNEDLSVPTSTTTRQVDVPAPGRVDAETEARLDAPTSLYRAATPQRSRPKARPSRWS
ncbi:hypothetical protein OG887_43730 (plasmid) [Streptomyces sp. NBC_00053]|uniref:hypothetical protein n=1 Tax=unclassified Streptomyces TaxID=2593676 RepID=UPI002258E5CC|nr:MULTISPECIES: hypothetical protein [unclassified Streptomyces]MCX4400171.1 hypothetical protein [Streptomyces sp. NBC_01767]MCX5106838.1 hypothetical protein [Streptomyces sp. NBC_00439]MCX5506218.1 hypothetical protein [Streptomyces sp. NBC_00052]MCX5554079.1 hypothetical protein [Streptomyces sp. NBC_00051]